MENIDFDLLGSDCASNDATPELSTSGGPKAGPAAEPQSSQAAERVGRPSSEHALPLLRLSSWESDKHYNKNNPVYMHYDL